MRSPSLLLGYIALTFAQITISVNVITGKYLLATMPMFMLLGVRFFLSTILLGLILKLSRTSICDPAHPEGKLNTRDWVWGVLQGFFAAFLFNVFFVWGLANTTATAAGIVGSTLPAIIALCAVWMLKERLSWVKISALALAMFGILVINLDHFEGGGNLQHSYIGDFLIFLAMIPEAWYSILSRKLAGRMTPLGAAFVANLVGCITLVPCALFSTGFEWEIYSASEAGLLIIAALSSVIFYWAWGWGLTFIPASTAAVFGGVMPVATTLLALYFLQETLGWYDIIGMGCVVGSILLGAGLLPFRRKSLEQPAVD